MNLQQFLDDWKQSESGIWPFIVKRSVYSCWYLLWWDETTCYKHLLRYVKWMSRVKKQRTLDDSQDLQSHGRYQSWVVSKHLVSPLTDYTVLVPWPSLRVLSMLWPHWHSRASRYMNQISLGVFPVRVLWCTSMPNFMEIGLETPEIATMTIIRSILY